MQLSMTDTSFQEGIRNKLAMRKSNFPAPNRQLSQGELSSLAGQDVNSKGGTLYCQQLLFSLLS